MIEENIFLSISFKKYISIIIPVNAYLQPVNLKAAKRLINVSKYLIITGIVNYICQHKLLSK